MPGAFIKQLSSLTSKGRFTLISAIVKRKDEVYRRLDDEFKTIEMYTQNKFNIIEVAASLLQVNTICQPLYFLLLLKMFPNPL